MALAYLQGGAKTYVQAALLGGHLGVVPCRWRLLVLCPHVFRWLALARLKGDGFAASRTLDHFPLARLTDEVAIRSLGDAFEVHRVDVRGAERSTD